jgi:hypothetical protein
MLSMPPATTTSLIPNWILWAASMVAATSQKKKKKKKNIKCVSDIFLT